MGSHHMQAKYQNTIEILLPCLPWGFFWRCHADNQVQGCQHSFRGDNKQRVNYEKQSGIIGIERTGAGFNR